MWGRGSRFRADNNNNNDDDDDDDDDDDNNNFIHKAVLHMIM